MGELKNIRTKKKLTQIQAAALLGVSLRSYKSYENDQAKQGMFKYRYMVDTLSSYNLIDEEHGLLELEDIISLCRPILDKYDVEFCYLFGSYARNEATPASDIDLLASTNTSGFQFYALVEELRTSLNKKVDLLNINQLKDNLELTHEILKDGIKIYEYQNRPVLHTED